MTGLAQHQRAQAADRWGLGAERVPKAISGDLDSVIEIRRLRSNVRG
jgi:hypothetical protein